MPQAIPLPDLDQSRAELLQLIAAVDQQARCTEQRELVRTVALLNAALDELELARAQREEAEQAA
jgi:hypothetical protein